MVVVFFFLFRFCDCGCFDRLVVGGRRLLCLVVICTYEIRRDVAPCGFHNDGGV